MARRVADAPFAGQALVLAVLVALAVHWPVLSGRVLLPADIVLAFPPWAAGERARDLDRSHAEMGDLVTQSYLWRSLAGDSLAAGELPLWNRRSLLGEPFLANPQTALFWPPTWLHAFLGTPLAWNLALVLEGLFAFWFTALLAREIGCTRPAALLAATAFSLSAFAVSWQGWSMGSSLRALPFLLWALARLRRRAGPGSVVLTALGFASPVLAGHPQTALYDVCAGLAFAGYLSLRSPGPKGGRRRFVGALALAAVLAVALAAVQLLPTVEWIDRLARSPEASMRRPAAWGEAVSWLSRDTRANPNGVGVAVPEGATYPGLTVLLLAPLAWCARRRRPTVAFWTVLGLLAVAGAHGWGPAAFVSRHAQGLSGLPLRRLAVWSVLAAALLGGLGASALVRRAGRPLMDRSVRWTAAGAILAVLSALAVATVRVDGCGLLGPHGLASSWLVALAGATALLAALHRSAWAAPAAWALVAISLADHVHLASGHLPAADREDVFPPAPLFEVLGEVSAAPDRVGYLHAVVPPNAGLAYGLDDVGGYNYADRLAAELLEPVTGGRWNYFQEVRLAALGHPLLDLLNVRYLVTPRGFAADHAMRRRGRRYPLVWQDDAVAVFENAEALPRAFLVPWKGIRIRETPSEVLDILRDPTFDPRRFVLLDRQVDRPLAKRGRRGAPPRVELEIVGHRRLLHVSTPSPAILVISELAYPGWQVTLDGRSAELLTVDHALQGVAVPRGEHRVELRFDPGTVRWGARISSLAVLVVAGCGVRGIFRRGPRRRYRSA